MTVRLFRKRWLGIVSRCMRYGTKELPWAYIRL